MRYLYVQAHIHRNLLISDGPGAVEFFHTEIEAENEDDAYTLGARVLPFRQDEQTTINDYAVPIWSQWVPATVPPAGHEMRN